MIIGIDVGGTHIDGVIIKNKQIIKKEKNLVDFNNLEDSILILLNNLIKDIKTGDIKQINLSTTISTNAIVENKASEVGLIIQTGPGINLSNYDNSYVYSINGYTDHRGMIVDNINKDEIDKATNYFKDNNINYVAVATKFSTRNPLTEQTIYNHIKDDFKYVSLSHELSGRLNFPRRITTAILNSSVVEIFNNFSNRIINSLKTKDIDVPIYILKADGGLMALDDANNNPVQTILSGPAASLMGFLALLDIKEDSILLDIGGTTTDIFILADGVSLFEPLGATIDNKKTLIRSIFSKSIGLGGDSEINVVDSELTIGPKRKGKPFSLGGPKPTLTDAFIYLKHLNIGSKDLAFEAMNLIANELSLNEEETALKIIDDFTLKLKNEVKLVLQEVNQKPVYTIKELLENKKIVPKSINIVGGPAKLLKPNIKKQFNLKTSYPDNYNIANAIGAALSRTTAEVNIHADTHKQILTISELGKTININQNLNLQDVTFYAYEALSEMVNNKLEKDDYEIVEQSSFNMVSDFYTKGKNIRVKAQVKPGLIYKLEGDLNDK